MASFAVQKLLSLIRPLLFTFVSITLGDKSKKQEEKTLLQFRSKSFLPMFSSMSFIVPVLHVGHVGFIFVYSVRECSDFILFHVVVQLPPTEETVFSPWYILASFIVD